MKKNAGVSILISDKVDFSTRIVTRDKEGHYMKNEGVRLSGNYQENITVLITELQTT